MSKSDPIEFFPNPVRPGSGFEFQNPMDRDPESESWSTLPPATSALHSGISRNKDDTVSAKPFRAFLFTRTFHLIR